MGDAKDKIVSLKDSSELLVTSLLGLGGIELAKKFLENADATVKLANTFGLTVASTLELQAAFSKVGVSGEGTGKVLSTLAMNLEKLQEGDLAVRADFQALGLSFKDIQDKGMSMKDIIEKIALAMANDKGNVEKLTAARTLLGKAFIGKDPEEFLQMLEQVRGKEEEAAQSTKYLAEIQDKLEKSAVKVKTAFLELLGPIAKFFADFIGEGDRAKETAKLLFDALLVIAGATLIKGINALVGSFSNLAASMVGTLAPTLTAGKSIDNYANSLAKAITEANFMATTNAKLGTSMRQVAVAEAELEALLAQGIVAGAEYNAKIEQLIMAEDRLTRVTAEHALTRKQLNTAMETGALAAGAVAATTEKVTNTTGAAVGAIATMWAWLGRAATVIGTLISKFFLWLSVAMLVKDVINMVFDVNILDKFMEYVGKGIDKLKEWTGIGITKEYENELKRLENRVQSMNKMAEDKAEKDRAAIAIAQQIKDKTESITAQYEAQLNILKKQDSLSLDRIKNQQKLLGMSAQDKAFQEAYYTESVRNAMEIFQLEQQIATKRIEQRNADKSQQPIIAAEIEGMLKRKNYLIEIGVTQAKEIGNLARATELEKQRLEIIKFRTNLDYKRYDQVKTAENEIAKLTMTENEKKIQAIKEQMAAEAQAEIRRREAMLAPGEFLDWAEQLKIIDEVAKAYDPIIQANQKIIDQSQDFSAGWTQALKQYGEDSDNRFKRGQDTFNAVINDMDNALQNFVTTGKFSFRDFATSIIQDMIKMELKAQASTILRSLFGDKGTGGLLSAAFSGIKSFFGFAEGGSPPVGVPSIVGEKGPELFIPREQGTVIPNSALGGGPTNVTNNHYTYNVSAIDGRSVAQFFAENRKVMLGTMQLAQKEMPYSNR